MSILSKAYYAQQPTGCGSQEKRKDRFLKLCKDFTWSFYDVTRYKNPILHNRNPITHNKNDIISDTIHDSREGSNLLLSANVQVKGNLLTLQTRTLRHGCLQIVPWAGFTFLPQAVHSTLLGNARTKNEMACLELRGKTQRQRYLQRYRNSSRIMKCLSTKLPKFSPSHLTPYDCQNAQSKTQTQKVII